MSETDVPPRPVQKSRRRWLQFSLRTLLLVVAALCVWLGAIANRAHRQRLAIDAIHQARGTVQYDFELPAGGSPNPKAGLPGPDWLRNLIGLEYFATAVTVNCNAANDQTAKAMANLAEVRCFDLSDSPLGDDGLQSLRGLAHVEVLNLSHTRITDAGLAHLKGLARLEVLNLRGTRVTDAGAKHLQGMTSLTSIILDQTRITDAGLIHLKDLARLKLLDLEGTQVTDAGLEHLKAVRSLRTLYLGQTRISEAGAAELQRALPNCRIGH